MEWKLCEVRWLRRRSLGGRCCRINSRSSGIPKTRAAVEEGSMVTLGEVGRDERGGDVNRVDVRHERLSGCFQRRG